MTLISNENESDTGNYLALRGLGKRNAHESSKGYHFGDASWFVETLKFRPNVNPILITAELKTSELSGYPFAFEQEAPAFESHDQQVDTLNPVPLNIQTSANGALIYNSDSRFFSQDPVSLEVLRAKMKRLTSGPKIKSAPPLPSRQITQNEKVFTKSIGEQYIRKDFLAFLEKVDATEGFEDGKVSHYVKLFFALTCFALRLDQIPNPQAMPGSEDDLSLVWQDETYQVGVNVYPDGLLDWYWLDIKSSDYEGAEAVPIVLNLSKLFSRLKVAFAGF